MLQVEEQAATRISDGEKLTLAAGILFSVAFQKYAMNDPLSQSTGVQGILETGAICLTFFIIVLLSRGKSRHTGLRLPVLLFGLYGVFALTGSVNSFNPQLSIVKAVLFFFVLIATYLLCEMQLALSFLKGAYYGYIASTAASVVLSIVRPHTFPLFSVDTYEGRTRLNIFDTHANATGEISGLFFLLAQIAPLRTRWYCQLFLLGANLLAGEKTATLALIAGTVLILLLGHHNLSRRWGIAIFAATLGCVWLVWMGTGMISASPSSFIGRAAGSIYGSRVAEEVNSLDGRQAVWAKGIELVKESPLLGYGFEGARNQFVGAVNWSGQAHNAFIQAAISAGLFGLLAFIAAWGLTIVDSMKGDRTWRVKVFCLHLYLFALAMIGPIFDTPLYFTMMVILTLLYLSHEHNPGRLHATSGLESMPGLVADSSRLNI
jgi:O-antigen ligase